MNLSQREWDSHDAVKKSRSAAARISGRVALHAPKFKAILTAAELMRCLPSASHVHTDVEGAAEKDSFPLRNSYRHATNSADFGNRYRDLAPRLWMSLAFMRLRHPWHAGIGHEQHVHEHGQLPNQQSAVGQTAGDSKGNHAV